MQTKKGLDGLKTAVFLGPGRVWPAAIAKNGEK